MFMTVKMYDDSRYNMNSGEMRAVVDGQFVALRRQTETNDSCLLIFVGWTAKGISLCCSFCHPWQWEWMSDIMLDQLWPLYSPSGNVDEFLNHTLWLSLQLCASAPQNLSFLSSLLSLSLSLLISPSPFFSPCFLSLHLRIWFVMVTERGDRKKCLLQEKKCL